MRTSFFHPVVGGLAAILLAVTAAGACAETCIDTGQNNPAFSSSYSTMAKPCPDAARPKKPTHVTPEAQRAARERLKTPVVAGSDKPEIVPTEHGTLIRSGQTTVCISGSVSVDIATGHGGFAPVDHPAHAPGCY